MFVRSKFFLQIVEKMEKLELNLSKQHNKMLKIKSGNAENQKKCENNQARKHLRRIFPGNFPNPRNPEDSREIF